MEKLFAVSYIDWLNNELTTEFIKAESELDALARCAWVVEHLGEPADAIRAAKDQEELKEAAFNSDGMINAVEVPQ